MCILLSSVGQDNKCNNILFSYKLQRFQLRTVTATVCAELVEA
ncbi:hypothetical protein CRENPOLYSF1_410028 [Crenothrix polyspora]|uniref:Uncharacterized protein n=1 Tax=Crenothrix polyspora TaxID=360316 RepID=A0A1R4HAN6_9GAMM|nr:hypothetical protein CRENPOLYSF1_410028 [Crenothrix polyspora]